MATQMTETHLYINATGYFVPEKRIPNSYFSLLHEKPESWFVQRTGILTRARASEKETIDQMSLRAVRHAITTLPFPIGEVDLIIFASYSPDDTVGTTGHRIQREFNIEGAKVFYLSSACSSALNAIEVVRSFFLTGIARKALVIAADRNSTYADDNDPLHGHLWGDAAVAYFISTESYAKGDMEIVDIETRGLGHIGSGPEGVYLRLPDYPSASKMPHGKDVFNQACVYIERFTRDILGRNGLDISSLDRFVSHQANLRIVSHVCKELGLPEERTFNNITELGNTGCGSSLLALAHNREQLRSGDNIVVATFGGGYSAAAMLLKVV
jgi:3-oxoacyl-[acyl-carrier-protein] synthase-3